MKREERKKRKKEEKEERKKRTKKERKKEKKKEAKEVYAAHNTKALKKHNITHIVTCTVGVVPPFPEVKGG